MLLITSYSWHQVVRPASGLLVEEAGVCWHELSFPRKAQLAKTQALTVVSTTSHKYKI